MKRLCVTTTSLQFKTLFYLKIVTLHYFAAVSSLFNLTNLFIWVLLDEAKRVLYNWYYNIGLPKWGRGKFQVVPTDTDSVYRLIETPNVYNYILSQREEYDHNDYDASCPVFGKYHDSTKY